MIRAIVRGLQLLVLFFSASAFGAHQCRDLFSTSSGVPTTLESKFIHSDLILQFRSTVDQEFVQDVRVWVGSKDGALSDRNDGVERKQIVSGGRPSSRFIIQGSVDAVLSALRDAEITTIEKFVDIRSPSKPWPYFSDLTPDYPSAEWGKRLSEKFQSEEVFKSFRKALRLTGDTLYRVTIRISGVPRASDKFERFVRDIRRLGILVEPYSLKNQSKTLTFTSNIDQIHKVIRHPIIKDVIRFEENPSEEQLSQRREVEMLLRARVRNDLAADDPMVRSRIAIDGHQGSENVFIGYRDKDITSLVRLEPEGQSRSIIPHEAQTAKDYATFLGKNYGYDFAYVAELGGKSVPVFDGIVLHRKTQGAIANVSLKFASNPAKFQDLEHLKVEVEDRFAQLRSKHAVLTQPDEWFRAANNLAPEVLGQGLGLEYDYFLAQARALKNLFGLFPPPGKHVRETRIVVDMRTTAFTVDYFKNQFIQDFLRSTLKRDAAPMVMLTLIWNDRQVVEVRRETVKIYE